MAADAIERIMEMDASSRWLQSIYPKVKEKYAGKYIAVEDKRIVASSADYHKLLDELKRMGKDPQFMLIEYIPTTESVMIL